MELMNIKDVSYHEIHDIQEEVVMSSSDGFILANTFPVKMENLKNEHIIPVLLYSGMCFL